MSSKTSRKNRFSGFTTIELLIVIVVIIILASLIVITHNGIRRGNHDTDRKSDIIKIEGQIEAYQAETDKYPSAAQMNDANFRTTNFKELKPKDLTDPLWKSSNTSCTAAGVAVLQDSSTPVSGCYGYKPSPAGCDNKTTDCTSYILTANLETGGTYSKESIN